MLKALPNRSLAVKGNKCKSIHEAWNNVTKTTIKNGFRKSGFDLTDDLQPPETVADDEISAASTMEISGTEYNVLQYVKCDDDLAFTQLYDDMELRRMVIQDELDKDYEEEDLIPLAELRLSLEEPNDCDNLAPSANILKAAQVSSMLREILTFVHVALLEIVEPIESCHKILLEKKEMEKKIVGLNSGQLISLFIYR